MKKTLITLGLATMLGASLATAGDDAPERSLYLHYNGKQTAEVDQPLKLRLTIYDNELDLSAIQVRVSWPDGAGDFASVAESKMDTWASSDDVTTVVSPSLGNQAAIDDSESGNRRRDLTVSDIFGNTSFASGEVVDFEFTPSETGAPSAPFTILLRGVDSGDTVIGQDPVQVLPVDEITGIHVIPGQDPMEVVLADLLGQISSVDDSFKDSNFDQVVDSSDLVRFR